MTADSTHHLVVRNTEQVDSSQLPGHYSRATVLVTPAHPPVAAAWARAELTASAHLPPTAYAAACQQHITNSSDRWQLQLAE